jgi:type I restriction enzyme, S subunit
VSHAWPLVPLGEVLRHRSEFITIDDTRRYQRCRVQLHGQGVVRRDVVEGLAIKTKSQQVCRAGEFLVAEIDAKHGGFGVVPAELDGAIVSSHYFLFVVDGERLDGRFLGYVVRTDAFRNQVSAQGSTNYAAIRPADVLGYRIPLPPPDEQRRIVDLQGQIDQLRQLQAEVAAEIEALSAGVMERLFGADSREPAGRPACP